MVGTDRVLKPVIEIAMKLEYEGKIAKDKILKGASHSVCIDNLNRQANLLVLGDNLQVMLSMLEHHDYRGSIDLVYIDPPFATNNSFTIGDGRVSTISSSKSDKVAYQDTMVGAEFLEFIRQRLIVLRELMSDSASIFLHIDYKIGHYVKIIMDEVFGAENFRNDISRIKCNPKNFKRRAFGNVKDLILFYTKTPKAIWNEPTVDFTEEDYEKLFKKVNSQGQRYTTIPLHAPGETENGPTGQEWRGMKPPKGRHWRSEPAVLEELDQQGLIEWSKNGVPRKIIYAHERKGKKRQDIWEFKDKQYPIYPTEKNLDLLKMIVETASDEGSIVLDCFCGSGSTLLAAGLLNRRWIGIDSSEAAIKVAQERMLDSKSGLFESEGKMQVLEYS